MQRREILQRKGHTQAPTFHLSLWLPKGIDEEGMVVFEEDLHALLAEKDGVFDLSRVGSLYTQESTGRRSQLFRIVYWDTEKSAMATQAAKLIHESLCDTIAIEFPDWECR